MNGHSDDRFQLGCELALCHAASLTPAATRTYESLANELVDARITADLSNAVA
jgi:hypothetical protein